MSEFHESNQVLDYVQNALEASCDALMTLESIRESRVDGPDEVSTTQLHVAQAIASLRHAISELRLAHDTDVSAVGLGFVVPTGPRRTGKERRP
jgi:hypothetical protein